MRKLATIRKIASLTPIPDADRIEVAQVDGWKVVVQKGLHEVGDLVVYFEIDSLLPIKDEFEFLRKGSYVKNSQEGEGFRLKTIKLRGQISQGLIIPIRELKEHFIPGGHAEDPTVKWWGKFDRYEDEMLIVDLQPITEGTDVTEVLGVKKYEKIIPAQLAGQVRGSFPSFIPKTDQERIQNFIGSFLTKYRDHKWECTLKLDGSSMTVYLNGDDFGVCSRNMNLKETEDNSFWQVARKNDIEQRLRNLSNPKFDLGGLNLALQGELMGPGVQGNREQLKELDFYIYDVWSIDAQRYLDPWERRNLVDALGLKHVPVYEECKYGFDDADGFLLYAEHADEGKSINHPIREGMVFKSFEDPSVSFKAINNRYLLAGGE
jgi:RNA ligase (TIGR02306 family)